MDDGRAISTLDPRPAGKTRGGASPLGDKLVKTYRTKSAKDLSYFWQACYLLGLIGISIYGVAYKLWPVAIPLIIEIVFMVTLTVLKYRYDKRAKRKKAAGAGAEDVILLV
ncbi:unnamed protein product [Closterium sp. NIES-64]|nr:unnamed protein product [Closterium sp. NIES-64]